VTLVRRGVSDGSVTSAQLADGAVTTIKIADGAVTNTQVGSAAAISRSKFAAVPDSVAGVAAYDTDRQPSLTNPTLIAADVRLTCTKASGDSSQVALYVDENSPPTTLQSVAYLDYADADTVNASSVLAQRQMVAIVPAGHYYRFEETLTGSATSLLARCVESVL